MFAAVKLRAPWAPQDRSKGRNGAERPCARPLRATSLTTWLMERNGSKSWPEAQRFDVPKLLCPGPFVLALTHIWPYMGPPDQSEKGPLAGL